MTKQVSTAEAAALMASDDLFALFDVRERGEYNECQIARSTSLSRSQIELRIGELVPNRKVPLVVYDEGGRRAELAADTLTELGYGDVAVVQGGLDAWRRENRETVSGVNVPSKMFGERVYHEGNVPELSAQELKAILDRADDLAIIDVRTPEEYGRFCIPGGINVPGGDLILWAEELRQKPTVIVNCAGRTRSIIAAAALGRLGLDNVRALKNGTMGWVLAGYELEQKPARRAAAPPSHAQALAAAGKIAADEKVAWTTVAQAALTIANSTDGVNYLIDVRSETEFATGHIVGSINVPGGQAVQRADDFVPVRGGRVVFVSNHSARAVMAAYWYGRMGFKNVSALRGGIEAWQAGGGQLIVGAVIPEPLGFDSAVRGARFIDGAQLQKLIGDGSTLLLDVSTSLEHEVAHAPRAKWISRGWIDLKLPELFPDRALKIVLMCQDGRQSVLAARQLAQVGYGEVWILSGGMRRWTAAGFETVSGLESALTPANDVVLSPSIRGSKEEMQNYLNWELTLKH